MGLMQLMPTTAAEPRREQPMGSRREHSRRDATTFASCSIGTTATRNSRSLPTTRALAPLRSMAAGYLRTARRATTFVRSAPRRVKRPAASRDEAHHLQDHRDPRWPRRAAILLGAPRRRDPSKSSAAEVRSDERCCRRGVKRRLYSHRLL